MGTTMSSDHNLRLLNPLFRTKGQITILVSEYRNLQYNLSKRLNFLEGYFLEGT